ACAGKPPSPSRTARFFRQPFDSNLGQLQYAAPPSMSGARVEIRQLRKSYDHGGQKLQVLRGIDLMIGAGEMVAVVGSSGAGKSTLLHVLGTLDQPSAGAVLYDGVEVTRM